MTDRSKAVATGLVALSKSALLLAGVPLALSRLWLLAPGDASPADPGAWRGGALWAHAVLACVGLLWLVAAASLGRDLVLALRGRLASPSASWSARWASRVAGLALVISAGSVVGAATAGAATTAHIAAPPPTTAIAAGPAAIAAGGATIGSPSTGAGTATARPDATDVTDVYVVRPGDCLSSIAEDVLGDAGDWTAIARLNMGRLQPDGRRMTDPSLIYPGWRLLLPTVAAPHESLHAGADPRPAAASGTKVRVSAPAPTRGAAPVAGAREGTGGETARPAADPSADGSAARPTRRLEELAILGIGLLGAAGVARRVRLVRRIGECLRRPGTRLPAPPDEVGDAMAGIDPIAESPLVDWIDAANRLLHRACASLPRDAELPEPRLVRAGPDGVQLRLARAMPAAPDGFVALEGGAVWALDASLGLEELQAMTAGYRRYVPGLVPVGDAEDATYLVALGPNQRLVLHARDGSAAAPDLAAMLVALRTLPWASELDVELVGVEPPAAAEHSYRLHSSSRAELAELADTTPASPRARLEAAWETETLVVVGDPSAPGMDEELLRAVGRVAGLVTVGGTGSVRLALEGDSAVLEPDGIALARSTPSPSQLALAEAVLAAAAAEAVPFEEPAPTDDGTMVRSVRPVVTESIRPGPVEVRMLTGTPTVDGWAQVPSSKDHGRVVEVVGYLALHGHGATTDRIRDAVFSRGDRVASLGRVHNVCSAARTALGTADDGRSYLPPGGNGRYRLDPAVTCDWTRFEALRSAATRAEPEDAVELLVAALSLIDGVPLGDVVSGWEWLLAEGLRATVAAAIVDGAHHLAALATARGDLALAGWAVARGRGVEPWSEMLARDAMVVADLEGDVDGIRRLWRELEHELDDLDGNEPSPETRALYDELVGGAGAGTPPVYRSARNG